MICSTVIDPDDRAQVTGEDSPRQDRHLVLVRQEPLPRADNAFAVVADLEGNDRSNVQGDPLLRDAPFLDFGLTHRQGEEPNLSEQRHDESAVTGHHTERGVACSPAAGNQHRLVRCGHSVAEHVGLLADSCVCCQGICVKKSKPGHGSTRTVRAPRISITNTSVPLGRG
jgi:hypothetical protein